MILEILVNFLIVDVNRSNDVIYDVDLFIFVDVIVLLKNLFVLLIKLFLFFICKNFVV